MLEVSSHSSMSGQSHSHLEAMMVKGLCVAPVIHDMTIERRGIWPEGSEVRWKERKEKKRKERCECRNIEGTERKQCECRSTAG
jgi:hypothetical protein